MNAEATMLEQLRALLAEVENADPRVYPFSSREAIRDLQVAATELAMALDSWAWEDREGGPAG
jgi:hypothetical protein